MFLGNHRRIMKLAHAFGGVAVIAGLATIGLAQPPAVVVPEPATVQAPQLNPGEWYVKLAAATSLLGAVGAWLTPLIREAFATYRFRVLEQSRLRELVRWADSAIRANPSLPPRPEVPVEWLADEPSVTDAKPVPPSAKP